MLKSFPFYSFVSQFFLFTYTWNEKSDKLFKVLNIASLEFSNRRTEHWRTIEYFYFFSDICKVFYSKVIRDRLCNMSFHVICRHGMYCIGIYNNLIGWTLDWLVSWLVSWLVRYNTVCSSNTQLEELKPPCISAETDKTCFVSFALRSYIGRKKVLILKQGRN